MGNIQPPLNISHCWLHCFRSIWPHEIWLCNQNHINPMSVIWSRLKLFSQKKNIESMISLNIDFDSAPRSSNELKKSYFLWVSFLFNNFLILCLWSNVYSVNTSLTPHLPYFVPTCFLLQKVIWVDAVWTDFCKTSFHLYKCNP